MSAAEVLVKLGDNKALVALYVEAQLWEDAFALAEQNQEVLSGCSGLERH